ncbi:MAG TPA: translation initiation factor IF-2 N-terminal domain-containing protein, partial [Acidimicrobiales bacterium]|nr:translation initiation factor IF-2 N-terminal domain-containing protein [Acidimicrobiales bacterium]
MPKKIRVYELARELGLTNKEALDLCVALGIGVKSHSSSIEDAQADRVRRKADNEGLRRAVQPEEPADDKPKSQRPSPAVAGGQSEGPGTSVAADSSAKTTTSSGSRLVKSRPASEVTMPPAVRPASRPSPSSAPATGAPAAAHAPTARPAPPIAPSPAAPLRAPAAATPPAAASTPSAPAASASPPPAAPAAP